MQVTLHVFSESGNERFVRFVKHHSYLKNNKVTAKKRLFSKAKNDHWLEKDLDELFKDNRFFRIESDGTLNTNYPRDVSLKINSESVKVTITICDFSRVVCSANLDYISKTKGDAIVLRIIGMNRRVELSIQCPSNDHFSEDIIILREWFKINPKDVTIYEIISFYIIMTDLRTSSDGELTRMAVFTLSVLGTDMNLRSMESQVLKRVNKLLK